MRPAASLLLFTTLSGAGYGLLATWALLGLAGAVPAEPSVGLVGLGPALLLIATGLCASSFHLGRPERAWRAFTQWRTSWLSREAVAAVATFAPALALAGSWLAAGRVPAVAALLSAAGAALTVLCTGQIYATLVPIPRWHQPLTTPVFLALALAAGSVLAFALAAAWGLDATAPGLLALAALPLAWGLKLLWWRAGDTAPPRVEAAAAIGVPGRGPVRLVEPAHTAGSWLLDETGFRVARRHAAALRRLAPAFGGASPWLLVAVGLATAGGARVVCALAAVISLALGLAIERWLFFAEARHTSVVWYGEPAV
jgi:DMSO reductase anchor subunit